MIKIHDVHDLKKKNDGLSSRNSGEKFYIAEKSPLENCVMVQMHIPSHSIMPHPANMLIPPLSAHKSLLPRKKYSDYTCGHSHKS